MRPPVWLAGPGRLARASAGVAALVAAAIGLALALALSAGPPIAVTDPARMETVAQAVAADADYYVATAQALRADGAVLRPFPAFRLPTLVMVQAALPDAVVALFLAALAVAVGWAWIGRTRQLLAPPAARFAAIILLAAGMTGVMAPDARWNHDLWAGLLVAWSLASRREDRWIEPVAIGLAAMLMRETAALFAVAMAAVAFREGNRREAIGWAASLAVFAAVVALHARAAGLIARPLDPALPWWDGFANPGLLPAAAVQATAFSALPAPLGVSLALLAIAGWCAAPGALATRMVAFLFAVAVALTLFARTAGAGWAAIVAPALCVGLAFVPDLLRDLARAMLDRPRVRVQRITR